MEVSAIRDAEGEIDKFRGAVVFVIDPCAEHEIQTFGLSELYGLTKSELEVSRHMIAGRTCPEIADARHVSPETVKSQIRSTLAKTRSRNRAEFLRRVFSMNPPIDPG
ncbi:MAG: helix-turn-helix transcriptional regulator [Gammaproteobacteria bacterium]|nr:helix-turn-helix transcriptional regulator [Gammaproteobacteria bacterium]